MIEITNPDGSPRPIPDVTPALVAHLEALFPDKSPSLGTTQERIWFDAGAAAVVRLLRAELEADDYEAPPTTAATPFQRSRRIVR